MDLPHIADLAALRAWYEGATSREAVVRYLANKKANGQSSRGIIGRVRRQLKDFAQSRRRPDLADLFAAPANRSAAGAKAISEAIEQLRQAAVPAPLITDAVELWLPDRIVNRLQAAGINTLADLTVRVPRRHMWWVAIPGIGRAAAREVEAFFDSHPQLTNAARALVLRKESNDIVPWERMQAPENLDGSSGSFRAPLDSCVLRASNDHEAVTAWLDLHESAATRRAYQKEAERLMLWARVERGRALSSLSTEDAIAYRQFLRHPSPRTRWVGAGRPRRSPDWRPFTGDLSPRSVAYALSVIGALFRWLAEQRYLLANPFAGVKVRGEMRRPALDASRAFTEGEWALVRTIADALEWKYDWSEPAAERLRFALDFCYGTGLRAGELVAACLRELKREGPGEIWLNLVGKGSKPGRVFVPPLSLTALEHYLARRKLPTTPSRWRPDTHLLGGIAEDQERITAGRLWAVMKRFFDTAAAALEGDAPALAEKLRKASPHWMRHTHATHALQNGAELPTVRDNLRHASVSTTSIYLHTDDARRARQLRDAFSKR